MELPKSLKIGGHNYKILFPYIFRERFDHYAQHDFAMKEIRVGSMDSGGQERSDSAILVSFLHEVLHAIDYTTGHRIFEDNERAVEGFSEGLYQILTDNNWLKDIMPKDDPMKIATGY